jgi:CO/xanthine dehydrogenase Mo-binding subunit/aerobic-type carbon monoxide dehydrogenase small subunit (CoxS/CutS family)
MTARDLPAAQVVRMQVNGVPRTLVADGGARLADVLRDELGLTGTKIGCHAGDCGACTVLLDGAPVCACIQALGACDGRAVTTVEGLAASEGTLSPLQQAFVDHGAAQCGACTPGMLMAAEALLRVNPHPSESEVQVAIGGVLCRCTGYRKIVEAVLVASGEPGAAAGVERAPAAGRAVGARVPRLDAPAKVSGRERFGADVAPPGCLELRVVRSPHAHAMFVLGDLDAWRAAHPGILDVLRAADVAHNAFAIFPDLRDQPVLADGHVRFAGEAVLALVGEPAALLAVADGDLPIEWMPLPALADVEAALAAPPEQAVHARYPDNVLCRGRVARGDPEGALARAAHVARGRFETVYLEHAYIEPEAGYAELEDSIDAAGRPAPRVRIWACTQTPYMDRDEVAQVVGVDPTCVHVVPSAIGGGFGGKLDVSVQPLLAVAALKLRRPVRLVYERPESMRSSTKRHPSCMQAAAACDADGRLLAFDFRGDFNTGAYSSWGPTVANRVPIHACGPYRVPHVRALTRAVHTHDSIAGAFRGFGVPQAALLGERLMDALATACGLDALEFRHRNALAAGDTTATGQVLRASVGMRACLDAVRPAWRRARAAAAAFNAAAHAGSAGTERAQRPAIGPEGAGPLAQHRRGVGIACMWYGIGNTVIANPSTMQGGLRWSAARGAHVLLYNGAQEIGQGTATIVPQMFADALGLPLACVEQVIGDTDRTADAGKSSASRQTFVSGNAARAAGLALRARIVERLGWADDDGVALTLAAEALVGTRAGETRRLDLRALEPDPNGDLLVGRGHFNPPTVPLDADGQGVPYATYGFAAQVAEVEVDLELGLVRLLHVHAAHDIGRAINPTLVEGQIHGGIAQGLGMALMEEYLNGRTDNLHDYLIPTVGDMPPVTVHLIEDPEPLGPWGAKGVGEPALIATAPSILAAIRDATGAELDRVPVTPSRLRAAILAARAAGCST